MPYIYLSLSVLGMSSANILCGFFNKKNATAKKATVFYNLMFQIAALVAWAVLFCIEPSFDWGVVLYSLGFGTCFLTCNIGIVIAMKTGPVSLTSLIVQLSLIATTVWGFFFWDTPFTWYVGVGLALVVVSLWLSLYEGKKKNANEKLSLKWIVFVFLAFAGNAGCSIIQRTQQLSYNGQHGNLLMVCGLTIAVAFFLIQFLCLKKEEKAEIKPIFKKDWYLPVAGGLSNGLLNLMIILLASTTLSPSVIYPVLSVAGLAIVSIFSFLVFKEKMRWWQWLGVAVGAAAVAILSL